MNKTTFLFRQVEGADTQLVKGGRVVRPPTRRQGETATYD